MNKFFNETIKTTNKYIVLATPLILFTLISNLYFFIVASGKIINLLIGIVLLFFMCGAFIAGWFKMVKSAVNDEEDGNPNSIMKNFVSGVGEYILPSLGGIAITFIAFVIVSAISYFIGMKFIGDPGINPQELRDAMLNTAALKSFLEALTPEQIAKFGNWNLLLFISVNLYYFIIMLYFPTIFYENKNPLIAFGISLKRLFNKKIFKSIILFVIVAFLYFLLSLLSVLFGNNLIMHFLLTLLNFYFITAVAVAVFSYYNKNLMQSQLGQNVDLTI